MTDQDLTAPELKTNADLRAGIVALPFIVQRDPDDAYGVSNVDYIPRKDVLALIDRAFLASMGDKG